MAKSKSDTEALVAGIVGGSAVLLIVVGVFVFLMRIKEKSPVDLPKVEEAIPFAGTEVNFSEIEIIEEIGTGTK